MDSPGIITAIYLAIGAACIIYLRHKQDSKSAANLGFIDVMTRGTSKFINIGFILLWPVWMSLYFLSENQRRQKK